MNTDAEEFDLYFHGGTAIRTFKPEHRQWREQTLLNCAVGQNERHAGLAANNAMLPTPPGLNDASGTGS